MSESVAGISGAGRWLARACFDGLNAFCAAWTLRVSKASSFATVDEGAPGVEVLVSEDPSDVPWLRVKYEEVPSTAPATAVHLILVVDTSSSMSAAVEAVGPEGAFSRMDLVKHAIRTAAGLLASPTASHGTHRRSVISMVGFGTHATKVLGPTVMDEAGERKVSEAADRLRPSGCTDLLAGLDLGFEQAEEAKQLAAAQDLPTYVCVLTDGQADNSEADLLRAVQGVGTPLRPFSLHTFGFGNGSDGPLLLRMAARSSGQFRFIPDAGMVGTVCINFVAGVMAGAAAGGVLQGEPIGDFQYGQSRMLPLLRPCSDLSNVRLEVRHKGGGKSLTPTTSRNVAREELLPHACRRWIADLASDGELLEAFRRGGRRAPLSRPVLSDRRAQVAAWAACLEAAAASPRAEADSRDQAVATFPRADSRDQADAAFPRTDSRGEAKHRRLDELPEISQEAKELAMALSKDLRGQVSEALDEQFFWSWGYIYLLSLALCHAHQVPLNFKDEAMNLYGGIRAKSLQDKGSDIFCRLKAPRPSIPPRASPRSSALGRFSAAPAPRAVVDMGNFHNPSGGCFVGSSTVRLAHGGREKLQFLCKGTLVEALREESRGRFVPLQARVRCVVEMLPPPPFGFSGVVELPPREGEEGLRVTPWHPVLNGGSWDWPAHVPGARPSPLTPWESVYSVVLEEGAHALNVGGRWAVSLGHGLPDGLAAHSFWGRDILGHVTRWGGFEKGRVAVSQTHLLEARHVSLNPQEAA